MRFSSTLRLLTATFAVGVISVSQVVLAQVETSTQNQALPLQLDLDYATFSYGEDESLVEFYLAFEAATLSYAFEEGRGYLASVPVALNVIHSSQASLEGSPSESVWGDQLDLSFVIPDTTGLQEGQHFIHQVRAALPPGEYELQIDVEGDASSRRPDVALRRDVLVPDYSSAAAVGMSDITLASSIQQSSDRQDLFYKNGLVIRPNANQLFGSGLNFLFFYFEVYNLPVIGPEGGSYTAFMYIAEANVPQPLPDFQKRATRTVRSTDVIANSFNITSLPSGSYFLRIAILNEQNEAVAEQSRKFFIYNPAVQRPEPEVVFEESFESSQYAAMTEDEVKRMEEHIDIITTDQERRRMNALRDLDERRRFLMEFWRIRDPAPNTPINEYQEQFYSLVQYANDRYTSRQREGWQTDRGRTILKYGPPTSVEPHLFDRGYRPYEIWQYNNIAGEGQSQFVFADLDGFGLFELIHSTVTGERQLSNWIEELQI